MKRILLLLTLSALVASPVLAQDNTPPKDGPGGKHMGGRPGGGGGMLTPEEREQLKDAREAALKANPSLETEGKDLMAKMEAYKKKLNAAMIKADPKVEPLITKMESHRPHGGPGGFGGPGGGPPPPPPSDKD